MQHVDDMLALIPLPIIRASARGLAGDSDGVDVACRACEFYLLSVLGGTIAGEYEHPVVVALSADGGVRIELDKEKQGVYEEEMKEEHTAASAPGLVSADRIEEPSCARGEDVSLRLSY